ncbi:diguanylate cyclase [Sphingomonas donggukensis]|uniref:Diguanylate cyclase n=1 Tax=Sphingomonas donggukensis TaxID=2949093 RepID=A0ABY4TSG3_9SPHN|nr:sensor domain-containing diguanylate cyclase [Sphingomonas donggukensis]URW74755.1 diguanylate cyclase [Sphingomonas donggukensis]
MPDPTPDMARDASRLRALATLDLAGMPPEREFEALAALAAALLDCPIGMVTLIDRDRQWVAAAVGSDLTEVRRSEAFCNHTIESAAPLVVGDATRDPRFADNPFVTGSAGVRAYAGQAISAIDPATGSSVPVGAVCAVDTSARGFGAAHHSALDHLRQLAEALLEARALRHQAEAQAEALRRTDRAFRQAERMAQIGSWRLALEDDAVTWSEGVFRIYDLDPSGAPPLQNALEFFPPHARAQVTESLANTIETGAPFDIEVDFLTAKGRQRRVRSMGEIELKDGRPDSVVGVFQDVTDRHAIEESLRRSATIDVLTAIANRAAFTAEIERAVDAARVTNDPLALILVDLDRFKAINDGHGHLVGDDVLRAAGRRLRRVAPVGGFAARLGGDEFALLLTGRAAAQVDEVAERLRIELTMPVHVGGWAIETSATIGHASLCEDVDGPRALIHRADTALYHAKRSARGSVTAWGRMRPGERRRADAA